MENQAINCVFKSGFWLLYQRFYYCSVADKTIEPAANLTFDGVHLGQRSNNDVIAITFKDCRIVRIPQGLMKSFPNLKFLQIVNSKLAHIARADLIEYKSLSGLILSMNEISFLPGDLLQDMRDLEVFWANNNEMQLIEQDIFERLDHLQNVNLSECGYINMHYSSFNGKVSLVEIKQELCRKYENLPYRGVIERVKDNSKLSSDLRVAMTREHWKDFTIHVGNARFNVHKFVLIARCPMFSRLIGDNENVATLQMSDTTPEILRVIIGFIYDNKFPDTGDINLIHLLVESEKLELKELAAFAAGKLLEEVNAKNAFELLTMSNKYGHNELRAAAFNNLKTLFNGEAIDDCLAKHPELFKELIDLQQKKNQLMRKFYNESRV